MLAGDPFSDHPPSVCPVIGSFLRAYNDRVNDAAGRTSTAMQPRLSEARHPSTCSRRAPLAWPSGERRCGGDASRSVFCLARGA